MKVEWLYYEGTQHVAWDSGASSANALVEWRAADVRLYAYNATAWIIAPAVDLTAYEALLVSVVDSAIISTSGATGFDVGYGLNDSGVPTGVRATSYMILHPGVFGYDLRAVTGSHRPKIRLHSSTNNGNNIYIGAIGLVPTGGLL